MIPARRVLSVCLTRPSPFSCGSRGELPPPPIVFRLNWGLKGPKKKNWDCFPLPPAPPTLSQGLDDLALPLYERVDPPIKNVCYFWKTQQCNLTYLDIFSYICKSSATQTNNLDTYSRFMGFYYHFTLLKIDKMGPSKLPWGTSLIISRSWGEYPQANWNVASDDILVISIVCYWTFFFVPCSCRVDFFFN